VRLNSGDERRPGLSRPQNHRFGSPLPAAQVSACEHRRRSEVRPRLNAREKGRLTVNHARGTVLLHGSSGVLA